MARYSEAQGTRRSLSKAQTTRAVRTKTQAQKRGEPSDRFTQDHAREIVALVMLAVAVFLIFSLVATDLSGLVGSAVRTGLAFAFGRLGFLVPTALVVIAAMVVLEAKPTKKRLAGALVFLFGLFLLVGGAVPPFGTHGPELFAKDEFKSLAGGLGESLYAAFHNLVGVVGVAIVAWVAVLAGFSLATGITGLWLGRRTRKAAETVRTVGRRSTRLSSRGGDEAEWLGEWTFPGPSTPSGGEALRDHEWPSGSGAGSEPASGLQPTSKDTFDDWIAARPGERPRSIEETMGTRRSPAGVVDGAQAFADLYEPATGVQSQGEAGKPGSAVPGSITAVTACDSATPVTAIVPARVAGADPGQARLAPKVEQAPSAPVHNPRQIQLPVDQPGYILPEPRMLRKSAPASKAEGAAQRDIATTLVKALSQFGVEARVIGMVVGPRVTRYELQLAPGTKVGKVAALKDDLAYALATTDIRILTPIPGKSAVGVEVPNPQADWVTLGDIYQDFPKSAGPLMFWLGKDISGKPVYADLTRLPHLLIAGTTGSGKSGCVNCIVSSILLRSTPDQVRMIMIDPKKVELSHYDRIPHLLVPVVTNMRDAAGVLQNVVKEMEDRYELMELDHARNLPELNKARARRGERPLPYILIVIDELADLMMASPQEVEDAVIRLAQKSRAVGIHLVVATQRPSADVITGLIKANIPSRIAFAVSSQIDSRVILDVNGAETLLGQGDMLFKPLGSTHMQRIQGAYITEEEIALLVNHWRRQAEPEFREELLRRPEEARREEEDSLNPDADELLVDAARLVIETGNASVSMLQRRLRVGYTRAGRLIDMLERRGIVGPWEGSKPRQILVDREEIEQVLAALKLEEGSRLPQSFPE